MGKQDLLTTIKEKTLFTPRGKEKQKVMEVDIKSDKTASATYMVIRQGDTVAKTVQVSEHCNVDVNEEGWPVGIEIY